MTDNQNTTDEKIDINVMSKKLSRFIEVSHPSSIQGVWVFGSFASNKKIKKGDVDIFVGIKNYNSEDPITVSFSKSRIDVYTNKNRIYEDCLVDLQYGDKNEFLSRIPQSERIQIPTE